MRVAIDMRRMHGTGVGRYARNIFAAVVAEGGAHEFVAVVQSAEDAAAVRALAGDPAHLDTLVAPAAQFTAREMLRTPPVPGGVHVWHSPHAYQWALGASHATVLMLHDLIPITHALGARNVALREPMRAFLRVACRRAARFVANSAFTRDEFHARMGVPLDRIHVTHLAPDARLAAPVDPAAMEGARRRWALPARTVLYVGTSQPHKNLDRLLQAMALLDGPEAPTLAVIGPALAGDRAPLHARIAALGLAPRVRFLDWLTDDEVRIAYGLAAVLVLPSLIEGFGLTLLEAMQARTPVVASDIAVLREVAGDAALYADPLSPAAIAEALRRVLDDAALADGLRARGTRNLARFSWQAAGRETLRAYEAARTRRG